MKPLYLVFQVLLTYDYSEHNEIEWKLKEGLRWSLRYRGICCDVCILQIYGAKMTYALHAVGTTGFFCS